VFDTSYFWSNITCSADFLPNFGQHSQKIAYKAKWLEILISGFVRMGVRLGFLWEVFNNERIMGVNKVLAVIGISLLSMSQKK